MQSVAALIGTSRDRHPMRFFGLQEMPSVSFSVLQCPLKTRNQQKGSAQSSPQQHTRAKQFILDAGDDAVHTLVTLVCFSECYLGHPQALSFADLPHFPSCSSFFIRPPGCKQLPCTKLHNCLVTTVTTVITDHNISAAVHVGFLLGRSGLPEATSNGP